MADIAKMVYVTQTQKHKAAKLFMALTPHTQSEDLRFTEHCSTQMTTIQMVLIMVTMNVPDLQFGAAVTLGWYVMM